MQTIHLAFVKFINNTLYIIVSKLFCFVFLISIVLCVKYINMFLLKKVLVGLIIRDPHAISVHTQMQTTIYLYIGKIKRDHFRWKNVVSNLYWHECMTLNARPVFIPSTAHHHCLSFQTNKNRPLPRQCLQL